MSEMSVSRAIKERRSIKRFTCDPIEEATLEELLNTAAWAPNHGLREPWRFILFVGEGRRQLAEVLIENPNKGGKKRTPEMIRERFTTIPAHLLVIMPEDPRQKEWEEDFAAVCTFIQNLQLAAWEKGIGAIWKTDSYIYAPYVRDALGVKPGEKIVGLIHLGYPEKIPEARPRTDIKQMLTIVDSFKEIPAVEA